MKLIITINLDNAAMRDEDDEEPSGLAVAEILRSEADHFTDYPPVYAEHRAIRDANGNTIGSITVTE